MQPILRVPGLAALCSLLTVTAVGALWLDLLPSRINPFAPLDLSQPGNWFLDTRLTALRFDHNLCRTVLAAPTIDASSIPDEPARNGCGLANGVRLGAVGHAGLATARITCELAAALALWVEHEVQPAAEHHLGRRVAKLVNLGAYSCRNVIGNPLLRGVRSQHATANAIDIAGFVLTDGTRIDLARDWPAAGPAATFLREVHNRSCRYFTASLSPAYNAAHANHLHLDRGPVRVCR